MEMKETEAEVARWREACELEVEAGKNEIGERDKVVINCLVLLMSVFLDVLLLNVYRLFSSLLSCLLGFLLLVSLSLVHLLKVQYNNCFTREASSVLSD